METMHRTMSRTSTAPMALLLQQVTQADAGQADQAAGVGQVARVAAAIVGLADDAGAVEGVLADLAAEAADHRAAVEIARLLDY